MAFKYNWQDNEANFGPPVPKQVPGGCHITFEIIPKYGEQFVALRRPDAIPGHEFPPGAEKHPKGLLYFCHNLIRYGESVENFLMRTIKQQAGVGIREYKILDIESRVQEKDGQWSFMPYVLVILDTLPSPSKEVTEVVQFTNKNIPEDFGWWSKNELREFLSEHNL